MPYVATAIIMVCELSQLSFIICAPQVSATQAIVFYSLFSLIIIIVNSSYVTTLFSIRMYISIAYTFHFLYM